MKKGLLVSLSTIILLVITACKAECPPERISYESNLALFPALPEMATKTTSPTLIEIKGKEIAVDRVISGPICNDTWSGVVYVTCDIQIPEWERDPFFLQGCDFEVEVGTQVYVEAHRDKLFTEGCSCHE